MKRLAILILIISGISFGTYNLVSGQQADLQATPINTEFKMDGFVSVIDGIEVPQEVLEYVQLTYDGHAVTKAEKTVRNGQQVYKLRVDRDDQINDYKSFSLLFTMEWKLLGQESAAVPPPKPAPKPVEKPETPAPVQNESEPEHREEKPERKPTDEGGRGSGSADDSNDEEPEEPVEDDDQPEEEQ